MPTGFLAADTNFPRLTEDMPERERLNRIENYLYMLLEELRYTLSNLSEDNFNEKTLEELGETVTGGLSSTVSDLSGNVATLQQTATALTSRLDNFNGSSSTIEQTATSLTTRLDNFDGSGSTIEQTAEALNFAVFDPDGDVSLVSQKADRIDWVVASGGTASTFTLTPHMATLVADEITVAGVVTFTDLETAGSSVINGDNIELKSDAAGDSVSYLTYTSAYGSTFAQLHTRDNQQATTLSQDRYAFVIETPAQVDGGYCAMKLIAGDSMSLESGFMLYMKADVQTVIQNGSWPTRIGANSAVFNPSSTYCQQQDAYYFAVDGIYFNGTRILAT